MKHLRAMCRHLPNAISVARALLAVPVALALYRGGASSMPGALAGAGQADPLWSAVAAALIVLAAASDFLDGWLARAVSASSRIGQLLDPIADKIVLSASFLTLAVVSGMRAEIVCPVLIVIARDALVTYMRLRTTGSTSLAPSRTARVKTGAHMILMVAAPLLGLTGTILGGAGMPAWVPTGYALLSAYIWLAGLWLVAALSVWTCVAYIRAR